MLFRTSLIALLLSASLASASDGQPDTNNAFPAVGFYHVAYNYPGQPLETYGGCSGTLIEKDIFLTAAHCTFYDTRRLVEAPAYERAEAWVSLDPVVVDNDFRCFLRDIKYPGSSVLACDPDTRNRPRFHKAHSAGITHPSYPSISQLGNGSLAIKEPFAPDNTDVAVLLLKKPISGVRPLPVASSGVLDQLSWAGLELVGVGYGLNYHKSIPARPEEPGTNGPTSFGGDYGIRRIADLGTLQSLGPTRIVPTQHNSLGEDSVCYWDSGSPLFIARNGVVDQTVVGVLTGGALWCQGSWDPYQRVDIQPAEDFLGCVRAAAAAGDAQRACECGIEGSLGLCGGL